MVTAINAWIENGSPYQEGVAIYDQYGSDNFLKTLFKRQENAFNRKKLDQVVNALLCVVPSEQVIVKSMTFVNGTAISLPGLDRPDLPNGRSIDYMIVNEACGPQKDNRPELLKVISRIEKNYAELRGLHPYLRILKPGDELKELAFSIVRLGKENAQLWARRNFLAEGSIDPEEPDPEPVVPVMIDLNLLNRRESIRKSLSKARARLKKQKNPKPHTRKLVEQREQDLRLIDEEINEAKQKGSVDE